MKFDKTQGEFSRTRKLSAEDVISIRNKYKQGVSADDLSVEYRVHRATIMNIVNRRSWKSLAS